MNNGFVYILVCEMYGELSYENGACDIIMASKDYDKCLERLKGCLNDDINDYDFIIENGISVEEFLEENKSFIESKRNIYADMYNSKEDYDNGCSSMTYRIVEKYLY